MPPERFPPNDPREWLRRAKANLALAAAAAGAEGVVWEDLCFDCQQAAEKALKAILVHRRVKTPKTHSIEELLTLVAAQGYEPPDMIRQAARLSEYSSAPRYPGEYEPISEKDYLEASRLADDVIAWVGKAIGS